MHSQETDDKVSEKDSDEVSEPHQRKRVHPMRNLSLDENKF